MKKTRLQTTRQELTALYHHLQAGMNKRWSRDLPMSELLFDRWERAEKLGFGRKSSIYHNSYVYGDVSVGHHTWIGPFTLLDGSGDLTIGNYCSISAGVQIYTHDSVAWALSGGREPYERAPVRIGNCTFIGSQVVIRKGVEIGHHCVIGAGSFVTKSIPPYTIAAGTPCKRIGHVVLKADGKPRLVYSRRES